MNLFSFYKKHKSSVHFFCFFLFLCLIDSICYRFGFRYETYGLIAIIIWGLYTIFSIYDLFHFIISEKVIGKFDKIDNYNENHINFLHVSIVFLYNGVTYTIFEKVTSIDSLPVLDQDVLILINRKNILASKVIKVKIYRRITSVLINISILIILMSEVFHFQFLHKYID